VAAGVGALRPEAGRRVVEGRLEGRAEDPRLYHRRLVGLADGQHLVHVGAEDEADPAAVGDRPEHAARAGAPRDDGDAVLGAVADDLHDVGLVARVNDQVRHLAGVAASHR
jgi:hypothetical protein